MGKETQECWVGCYMATPPNYCQFNFPCKFGKYSTVNMNYPEEYYKTSNYADYLEREGRYKKTAYEIADLLTRKLSLVDQGSLILDYGCAVGFLLEGFKELGFRNVSGVELSDWARKTALNRGNRVISVDEFHAQPPTQVDLMIALDVFEHMTDAEIGKALIQANPKALLVRIPCSTDGGKTFHLDISKQDPTHINCKTKEEWQNLFRDFEFRAWIPLNLYTIYDSPGVYSCLVI